MRIFVGLLLLLGSPLVGAQDCNSNLNGPSRLRIASERSSAHEVDFEFGRVHYTLTSSPRPGGSQLLQLVRHRSYEPVVERAFRTLVARDLGLLLSEGEVPSATIASVEAAGFAARLDGIHRKLDAAFPTPERIEPNMTAYAREPRAIAARETMMRFLARESGQQVEDFASRVGPLHDEFLASLDAYDLSFFDYDIFSPRLDEETRLRFARQQAAWAALGINADHRFEEVHDSLRERFFELARTEPGRDTWEYRRFRAVVSLAHSIRAYHYLRDLPIPEPYDELTDEGLPIARRIELIFGSMNEVFAPKMTVSEKRLLARKSEFQKATESAVNLHSTNLLPFALLPPEVPGFSPHGLVPVRKSITFRPVRARED